MILPEIEEYVEDCISLLRNRGELRANGAEFDTAMQIYRQMFDAMVIFGEPDPYVSICLLKLARLAVNPKRDHDSWKDLVNYALMGGAAYSS